MADWGFPDFDAHEGVHLFTDPASGLQAVIAIHSTALGPAAGGARFWHYPNEGGAITDALRLSRGMSYKNAMAGLQLGGGKGVILAGEPGATISTAQLQAFGRAVDSLGGRYVTAEDVGMSEERMKVIAGETRFVSGLPVADGAAGGDPGPYTARGVYLGVKAAARRGLGATDMKGVRVAIQGVGSVGGGLALPAVDTRGLATHTVRVTLVVAYGATVDHGAAAGGFAIGDLGHDVALLVDGSAVEADGSAVVVGHVGGVAAGVLGSLDGRGPLGGRAWFAEIGDAHTARALRGHYGAWHG